MKKRLKVKVVPKAKKQEVVKEGEVLKVKVKSPPEKGKANQELIEILADYFNVSVQSVKFVSGQTSRLKIVEISE